MKRKSMSIKFLIISYSLLNAFYWAAFVCVAYINNTLMAAGYSSVAVGSATAIGGIVGAACLPLFGYIGDKMGTSKWVFAFNLIICGIMFMFFPRFVYRIFPLVAPMCLYVGIASLMRMPTANLMDAWAVATLAPYEVNYGKVRMWGSLASAVVGIPLGMVVGKAVGQNFPFYFAQVFVVLAVIICLLLPSGDAKQSRPKEKMDFKAIFANRPFMIYLYATFDVWEGMGEAFEDGYLAATAGGMSYDGLFSFIALYNYLSGKPMTDKGAAHLEWREIVITSAEECVNFEKYVDRPDVQLYSDETIKSLVGASEEDFNELMSQFNMEYVLEQVGK